MLGMIIKILSSDLASKVGKELSLEIEGEITIEELKREIIRKFPEVENEFSDRHFYNFSVNGKLIRQDEFKTFKLKNEDFVIIMPSIAGGGNDQCQIGTVTGEQNSHLMGWLNRE